MTINAKIVNILSHFYWVLVALSSAGFDYDYYTLFKVLLCGVSLIFILASKNKIKIFVKRKYFFLSYIFYVLTLLMANRNFDYWSGRIIFNMAVIFLAAVAMDFVYLKKAHLSVMAAIVVFAFFYRYNRFLGGDGKPLVHDQVLTLIVLYNLFFDYKKDISLIKNRFVNFISCSVITFLGDVRAALLSIGYVFLLLGIKKYFIHIVLIFGMMLVFILNLNYLVDSKAAGSVTWRIYHWTQLLSDYDFSDYIWGKGIGEVWRTSLNLDNFYASGDSYIDSHSYYVQLIADVGLFGFLIFLALIYFRYKSVNVFGRNIILIFLTYGLFQGGVWQFNMLWLLICSSRYELVKAR